jgi:hypothetical protein
MRVKTKIFISLLLVSLLACGESFAGAIYDEAKFMARLADWAEDEKTRGRQNYLDCLLGRTPFEGRISGIKDNSSFIRGESARVLSEMGGVAEVPILAAVARDETDPQARELMYLSAVKLDYQSRATLAEKEEMVKNFLQKCFQVQENFGQSGIPEEALEFIIGEAEDNQMQSVSASLDSLQKEVFTDNSAMQRRLAKVQERLSLFANKDTLDLAVLEGIYRQALGMNAVDISGINESLSEWAVYQLTRPDRDVEEANRYQQVANRLLVQLLNPAADKPRDVQVFQRHTGLQLKEAMAKELFLRSENVNPSFETASGTLPQGWTVNPTSQVTYPATGNVAASFAKSLEVNNPATSSLTTVTSSAATSFANPLPKAIEFGLLYKMYLPTDKAAIAEASGLVFINSAGTEEAQGASSITLKATVTIKDTQSGLTQTVEASAADNFPYSGSWKPLVGGYAATGNNVIQSAQLTVTVSGKIRLFLDDAFIRRSESEFWHSAPKVTSISALPSGNVFAGEYITLTAQTTADPKAGTLTGQWMSGLEGSLGSPVTGSGTLSACVKLTKEGEHSIFFNLQDEYGYSEISALKLKVLKPAVKLIPNGFSFADSSAKLNTKSGTLSFNLEISNIADAAVFNNDATLTKETYVYVDGVQMSGPVTSGTVSGTTLLYSHSLDTTRLANGVHELKAELRIKRASGSCNSVNVSYYSDRPLLAVHNGINAQAPKITAPKYKATVTGTVDLKVDAFTVNPGYVQYYLIDKNNALTSLVKATVSPFSATFNSASYANGDYQLMAVASYNSDAYKAYSDKVKISIYNAGTSYY